MKVFFIDDEKTNLLLFKALIEEDPGITCEVFSLFSDIQKRIKKGHIPDVLITDIKMPDFSGFDVVEIMAQDYPQIPTAYCTAFATLEDAFNSGDLHFKHELKRQCYVKPIKPDIAQFVRQVFEKQ